MTVKELIDILGRHNQDAVAVFGRDEGGYSMVEHVTARTLYDYSQKGECPYLEEKPPGWEGAFLAVDIGF